jgi:hypothetical protein
MDWKFGKPDGKKWPKGEDGEPVAPAYLKHISGGPLDLEVALNLLDAYGIPHISEYPNNGAFGKLIFGQPPSGMEVFVPETMLEDAHNILSADIIEEDNDE